MSKADGKMLWGQANSIVTNYQNNALINGQPRLYTRDAQGDPVVLKAVWMDIEHLNSLIAETNAALQTSNRAISGIRFYIALNNLDEDGNTVPENEVAHTLVAVGTVHNPTTEEEDNVRITNAREWMKPCPYKCGDKATALGS